MYNKWYTHSYQFAMALIVIDFTCQEGRGGGLVVKELAVADSQRDRISSYVLKKPTTGRKYLYLTLE
jgi:hypothetical protein